MQAKGIANAVQAPVAGNSVFVLADGTVQMCGKDVDGELADVSHREHLTPFKVPGLTSVRSASIDGGSTIVRLADGTVMVWGMPARPGRRPSSSSRRARRDSV